MKPWYQSLTIMSGVVFAVVQTLETSGVVPAGAGAELAKVLSGLAALIGLRRAAG